MNNPITNKKDDIDDALQAAYNLSRTIKRVNKMEHAEVYKHLKTTLETILFLDKIRQQQ